MPVYGFARVRRYFATHAYTLSKAGRRFVYGEIPIFLTGEEKTGSIPAGGTASRRGIGRTKGRLSGCLTGGHAEQADGAFRVHRQTHASAHRLPVVAQAGDEAGVLLRPDEFEQVVGRHARHRL